MSEHLGKACKICVAITGSVPTKALVSAAPVPEQITSPHEVFEAGGSSVHCHGRNDNGTSSSDVTNFAAPKSGIEKRDVGMIAQISTGERSGAGREWGGVLEPCPDGRQIVRGGQIFTGLEDNLRQDRQGLAPSNASLAAGATGFRDRYERLVATWKSAWKSAWKMMRKSAWKSARGVFDVPIKNGAQ